MFFTLLREKKKVWRILLNDHTITFSIKNRKTITKMLATTSLKYRFRTKGFFKQFIINPSFSIAKLIAYILPIIYPLKTLL